MFALWPTRVLISVAEYAATVESYSAMRHVQLTSCMRAQDTHIQIFTSFAKLQSPSDCTVEVMHEHEIRKLRYH